MQTPTPSPADRIVAASLAQAAEVERHGRAVLRRFSPSQLAAALYAAVSVEQLEGRLAGLDLDVLEDLSGMVQRLEREDEQSTLRRAKL